MPSADQSSIHLSTDSHTRDGISLKLALFNLQKYINEEDFVVDFMLKDGVKMLVKAMEGESGLSGNSLAVSPFSQPRTLLMDSMLYKE
jgi:engulfment/cell motility protein 1